MSAKWHEAPHDLQLLPAAAHVWLVETRQVSIESQGLLSPDEQRRAAAFHFEADRGRYTASHVALRCILSRYVALAPHDILFNAGSRGKPFIAGHDDVQFNLAHSGDMALVAVMTHARIGVDVEVQRALPDMLHIAERFFSVREREALSRLPSDQHTRAFFRTWTRKEAYIKALGDGLYKSLGSFDVSMDETARLLRDADDARATLRWVMADAPAMAGYAAAVAVERMPCDVLWFRWRG